jgi:transcriptional regulator with XRE-family HTH domain
MFFFDFAFADRLKSVMEERNIDAYLLASITNVSPTTVQRWLDGKFEPRHKNLARIVDALDVSSDRLLGRA